MELFCKRICSSVLLCGNSQGWVVLGVTVSCRNTIALRDARKRNLLCRFRWRGQPPRHPSGSDRRNTLWCDRTCTTSRADSWNLSQTALVGSLSNQTRGLVLVAARKQEYLGAVPPGRIRNLASLPRHSTGRQVAFYASLGGYYRDGRSRLHMGTV